MSTVLFKRGSAADMADTAITDGLLFFNEEDYKIYMDNGTERIQYGGDTDLISNPTEALLTNAFSARGSLDLFLQKTTVVDSKSNALSVTQNYIPLGCLAFKEAIGTNNYSGLGDGTISGGLTNLNTRVTNAQNGVNNLQSQLQVSGVNFYFDYKNGKYGWNSSSARGAGTFHPFSVDMTMSFYFSLSGSGRNASPPATYHSNQTIEISNSSYFQFTDTADVRIKSYSTSGNVAVGHSGSTWTFSLSAGNSDTNSTSASAAGWVTIVIGV